jgi:hypothetical protein
MSDPKKDLLSRLAELTGNENRLAILQEGDSLLFYDPDTKEPLIEYDQESGFWETEVGSGWEPLLQKVILLAIARKEGLASKRKEG